MVSITKKSGKYIYFNLKNANGYEVNILNLGGIIQSFILPDGRDIVLGYDTAEEYENNCNFFGALIGPYANRISGSQFELDGKTYTLEKNEGENHLHSGSHGIHTRIFEHAIEDDALVLTLKLPHMEDGYPGNVVIEVTYRLSDDNALVISYKGTSDMKTIMNLTNHTYFTLAGQGKSNRDTEVKIVSDTFTVNDDKCIPTGEFREVCGTPLDFTSWKKIGKDIDEAVLAPYGGYDHNYVINSEKVMKEAAFAKYGDLMLIAESDCPCMQFYTAQNMTEVKGKGNVTYTKGAGFCFETGFYPDACNNHEFPEPVTDSETPYIYETRFKVKML